MDFLCVYYPVQFQYASILHVVFILTSSVLQTRLQFFDHIYKIFHQILNTFIGGFCQYSYRNHWVLVVLNYSQFCVFVIF